MNNKQSRKKVLTIILFVGGFVLGGSIFPDAAQAENISVYSVHPCLNRVDIPVKEMHWLYVPESPDELYTEEHYLFLAGQLIENNIVDASVCPSGGLNINRYANACGMATALPTVIFVQNVVNEPVLQAWREVGVPPVLLKQMIRRESQFWPGIYNDDDYFAFYEYGFGHTTLMGMQNAMVWNRDLKAKACASGTCGETDESNAYLLLTSLIATCENCANGVDLNAVNRSVDILAEVVMGHCYQTAQIISNATDWAAEFVVDYPTLWKLTLMNYTSGPGCILDTISSTFDVTEGPMSWDEISANIPDENCLYGWTYAEQITTKSFDFPPN